MVPSSGKQYDPLKELEALDAPREGSKTSSDSKKNIDKSAEKKNANAGGSWFGGFFSKLTPKPKNQMILPDDSNPTVSWFLLIQLKPQEFSWGKSFLLYSRENGVFFGFR